MSYTIVRDEAAEIARLSSNLDNVVRRRCKIGKVTSKVKPWYGDLIGRSLPARPKDTFFIPPHEPFATWCVVDGPAW